MAPSPAAARRLPALVEATNEGGGDARRIAIWLGGRLLVATLMLGGNLLTAEGRITTFSGQVLSWLIVATYASTLGSVLLLRRARSATALLRFGYVQVALDLALELGLVWLVGGLTSGFTFLFGITTLAAAVLVGPGAARAAAAWAVVLYVTLSVATSNGWLPSPPDQEPQFYDLASPENGFALVRNVVGLALVGVLASYLSARLRRTGGELVKVTESAAALARLNVDIVRSIPAGLLTTDDGGRIETANPAAHTILRAENNALVGRPLSDFVDAPGDHAETMRSETIATRSDGSRIPLGYTRTALRDADGRSLGGLVVFQDLSEVSALRDAAERAERLAQLGRIAAGLAHEIRNPLGSISGSVQLVREAEELGAEDRKLLGIVVSEVARIDDLVATMLQLGRPRTLERGPHDLAAIAREVVDVARAGVAQASRVELEVEVPQAPVIAQVDGAQIRQVVWNLVRNAVQASPSGAQVQVVVRAEETGSATIEVRDAGHGVSRASLPRLFEAFYTERPQGTGLGLALVKQIVDAHGATITVESATVREQSHASTAAPRSGTTFRVTLPLA